MLSEKANLFWFPRALSHLQLEYSFQKQISAPPRVNPYGLPDLSKPLSLFLTLIYRDCQSMLQDPKFLTDSD